MALYTYSRGNVELEKVGNPTMTDGIASGFSSSDYYKINTPFCPEKSKWTCVIKARVFNFTSKHTLISHRLTDTRSFQLGTTTTGALNLYLSGNGTSNNIANPSLSTLTINTNTWYWFKIEFIGTKYEVLVSEDKENWTSYITVTSTKTIYNGTENSFGYNFTTYPEVLDGEIDFNETYIKFDDNMWFSGKTFRRVKLRMLPNINYTNDMWTIRMREDDYKIENGRLVWVNPKIYLENKGSSWIDTGITGVCDFDILMQGSEKLSSSQIIVGTTPNRNQDWFGTYSSTGYLGPVNSRSVLDYLWKHRVLVHFISNKMSFEASGVTITSSASSSSNRTLTYALYRSKSTDNYYAKAKIYYCKAYQNDTLIQHLVPVPLGLQIGNFIVPSNGMFDIVTQTFYGNQGTGSFAIGGIQNDYLFEGNRLIYSNPKIYLQNDDNNWLDLGFIANSDTQAIITYKIDSSKTISSNTRNWICGGTAVYTKMENFYGGFWQSSESNIYYWLNTSDKGSGATAGSAYADLTANYKLILNGTNIDAKSYIYKNYSAPWGYANNVGEITQTGNFILFNRYSQKGTASTAFLGKIFNCIITKDSQVILNLIPVYTGLKIGSYTVPSNGMWDTINQTFFENQGSGTFNYGKDNV